MGCRQLNQDDRYIMANMFGQGYGYRGIGTALDPSSSAIYRKRQRNECQYDGHYRAEKAHAQALSRLWRSRSGRRSTSSST